MSLHNERELPKTRGKLVRHEARLALLERKTGGDEALRDMTVESVRRTINQFKVEVARYEAAHPATPR